MISDIKSLSHPPPFMSHMLLPLCRTGFHPDEGKKKDSREPCGIDAILQLPHYQVEGGERIPKKGRFTRETKWIYG